MVRCQTATGNTGADSEESTEQAEHVAVSGCIKYVLHSLALKRSLTSSKLSLQ